LITIDHIYSILPSPEHFHVWGYWIAFFAALIETTIGIGLILPGSTIILLLGALSARGYLDVGDLIWFAILGAVIGDNINYFLGRKYFNKWLQADLWLFKVSHIEKAKRFMDSHGAKSVFLGRFIPSVKELIPFIAGSLKMNRKTFMIWNVLGGIGWGFEWVLAGYFFAQSLNLAELWLSRAGLFFAFLFISGGILYFLKWLIIHKGSQFLALLSSLGKSVWKAMLQNKHVLAWMEQHSRSLDFLRKRINITTFSGLPLTISTLAFLYVLALFAGAVEDLLTADPIVAMDIRTANLLTLFRTDLLTTFFTWITVLGKSQVIIVFLFTVIVLLWLWRKPNDIPALVIAAAGSTLFTTLGKIAFHRPRPATAVYAEHSFSFPSGHATIAVAFYGFIAYLLMHSVQSWNRKVNIFFGGILLILAIGFSRIYLGEHYISDVWSGYLVGAMWLIIAVTFAEWLKHTASRDQSLSPARGATPISFSLVALAAFFYVGFSMHYHPPPAPPPAVQSMVVKDPLDIFSDEQLRYTETPLGDRQEPLNVIFVAENDSKLVAAFREAGWTVTDTANIPSFFKAVKALLTRISHPGAPISPSFWNARVQVMAFAKVPGTNWLRDAKHVKIWKTNFSLPDGKKIFVGMANSNDGFRWGIMPSISPDLDSEREQMFTDLEQTKTIDSQRKIQLVKPLIGDNFIGDQFFTDGKAYVLTLR